MRAVMFISSAVWLVDAIRIAFLGYQPWFGTSAMAHLVTAVCVFGTAVRWNDL